MNAHRIAYVLKYFPKLSETFVSSEIAELRRRGTEICILSLLDPPDRLRHDFVANHELDKLAVYGLKEFPARLREFRPQLIHAHFATDPTEAARRLAAPIGVPFTFTTHGLDIYERPPADFAERAASAAAVVTVSEANARYIAQSFGVPREHLSVIPCGVDTMRFCPPDRTSAARSSGLPASQECGPIVCVARHNPVKNLGLLLEACATLRARGVEFRCIMIGDGPTHDELIGIRAQLKLEALVEMVGAAGRATVLEWLRRASV